MVGAHIKHPRPGEVGFVSLMAEVYLKFHSVESVSHVGDFVSLDCLTIAPPFAQSLLALLTLKKVFIHITWS